MKPQHLVKFVLACLISSCIFLPSCTKDNGRYEYPINPNGGTSPTFVNLNLTGSASNSDITHLNVDLQAIQYIVSDEEGWQDVNIQQSGSVDIISLLQGRSIRLNAELLPGNVKQLRLRLGQNNTVEINGELKTLNVSDYLKESGMTIYVSLEETSMTTNSLWLNFDATQSVYLDAVTNEYWLLPSITSFDENQTGSIEGFVVPADAKASVQLQGDVNARNVFINVTALADETQSGYFRFVGIPGGIYQVDMMAGDGTSRRKLVTMIEVKNGQTTQLGSNTLE